MRVAYDVSALLAPRTGIGHYSGTLLDEMLAIAPDVTFDLYALTTKNDDSALPDSEATTFRRIPLPGRLAVLAASIVGPGVSSRLLGDPDVVHGPNFWVPPLPRRNGLVTIHDLTFQLHPELCTPPIRRYQWLVPQALKSCALVLTPSETIKSEVVSELGFDEDRVVVTPEGVRGAFVGAEPDPELARSFGVEGDYVVFAGTQEPRKNLDRLIEAVHRLEHPDLGLLIVGPEGWGSVDLPAVATKLGVQNRVAFSGYVSDEQLARLISGARAFVFPSLYEGFGLPPLEAMAAGIPVVASRAGALPEVLGDVPFWCDPLDPDSIAAAIHEAVTDETARSAAIAAGLERAAGFTFAKTARETLAAYRRVASRELST